LDRVFDDMPSGALAVIDAADALRDELQNAHYLASFAPDPIYYAHCYCGSVFEIRRDGELNADDHDAIRDWDDAHAYCEADL